MTIFVHELKGCAPVPLAHYLKGLGILRLVSEQSDPSARGAWRDECFVLVTTLSAAELERFFLESYEPTPFVAPWNKGSGFFIADDPGLGPLEKSKATRFAPFRAGIAEARKLGVEIGKADAAIRALKNQTKARKGMSEAEKAKARAFKDDPAFKAQLAEANRSYKALKESIIPSCRLSWRGKHLVWMEAAVVLSSEGKPEYPALLGTGGNDGRLDFTNNAMQRIGELFDLSSEAGVPLPAAAETLASALWGSTSAGHIPAAIGQYFPGGAGGANSSAGPNGESFLNPWDFLLMMEGAMLFSSLATKRFGAGRQVQASAPFAVKGHAGGYASCSASDESARGEQWMPLWARPLSLTELRQLLSEGRAQVRGEPAQRALDLARAVACLGTARGLAGFERYAYLERNGQSNLAVPLGRIPVRGHPRARLVDDMAEWAGRIHREARRNNASARLVRDERQLSDRLFEALSRPDEPQQWQAVLMAAVEVESLQVAGSAIGAGPIPPLRPEWVEACDDGTPELRLALSLGLSGAGFAGATGFWDPIRNHWLPLDPRGRRFLTDGADRKRLRKVARVIAHGRDAITDCIAVVERRLLESAATSRRTLPVEAGPRAGAQLWDLGLLTSGLVDIDRAVRLARGFMALDAAAWARSTLRPTAPPKRWQIDDPWVALRLALLPWPLEEKQSIPADPAIVRRLSTGDASGALAIALRRLSSAGFNLGLRASATDPARARLWAAALAFPISLPTARTLLTLVTPAAQKEQAYAR